MSRAYIDAIMQNYGFSYDSGNSSSESDNSDSSSDSVRNSSKSRSNVRKNQNKRLKHKYSFAKGGNNNNSDDYDENKDNSNDKPSGGFPNIVLCSDNKEPEKIKDNVTYREIAADKAILSISQILKSRRNI